MKALILAILLLFYSAVGLGGAGQTGFCIGLPRERVSDEQIWQMNIDLLHPEKEPIVAEEDVIAYDRMSHSIELSPIACERMKNLQEGTVLLMCVNDRPVYGVVIWSNILSVAQNGVCLMKPAPWAKDKCVFRIICGYPSSEWFRGNDARDDSRIIDSLRVAGKLKEN